MTLIAVVMGCETSEIRTKEISKLLDYGFANYDTAVLAEKGQVMGEISLEKGSPESINAVTAEKSSVLVNKGEAGNVTAEAILWEIEKFPLKKGDQVRDFAPAFSCGSSSRESEYYGNLPKNAFEAEQINESFRRFVHILY